MKKVTEDVITKEKGFKNAADFYEVPINSLFIKINRLRGPRDRLIEPKICFTFMYIVL